MSFHLYILYSEQYDRFYVGQTNQLDKRIERHNNGFVRSTKSYRPWKLVYTEAFANRSEAVKRESEIKRWNSKIKIKKLVDASR